MAGGERAATATSRRSRGIKSRGERRSAKALARRQDRGARLRVEQVEGLSHDDERGRRDHQAPDDGARGATSTTDGGGRGTASTSRRAESSTQRPGAAATEHVAKRRRTGRSDRSVEPEQRTAADRPERLGQAPVVSRSRGGLPDVGQEDGQLHPQCVPGGAGAHARGGGVIDSVRRRGILRHTRDAVEPGVRRDRQPGVRGADGADDRRALRHHSRSRHGERTGGMEATASAVRPGDSRPVKRTPPRDPDPREGRHRQLAARGGEARGEDPPIHGTSRCSRTTTRPERGHPHGGGGGDVARRAREARAAEPKQADRLQRLEERGRALRRSPRHDIGTTERDAAARRPDGHKCVGQGQRQGQQRQEGRQRIGHSVLDLRQERAHHRDVLVCDSDEESYTSYTYLYSEEPEHRVLEVREERTHREGVSLLRQGQGREEGREQGQRQREEQVRERPRPAGAGPGGERGSLGTRDGIIEPVRECRRECHRVDQVERGLGSREDRVPAGRPVREPRRATEGAELPHRDGRDRAEQRRSSPHQQRGAWRDSQVQGLAGAGAKATCVGRRRHEQGK